MHSAYVNICQQGTISKIKKCIFIIYRITLSESLNAISLFHIEYIKCYNPKPRYNEKSNNQITLEPNRTEFLG